MLLLLLQVHADVGGAVDEGDGGYHRQARPQHTPTHHVTPQNILYKPEPFKLTRHYTHVFIQSAFAI